MSDCKITALRSIELGVTDLERATRFYCGVWGLRQVSSEDDARYFRANSDEHHAVCVKKTDVAQLIGFTLAAANIAAVDALYEQAGKFGATVLAKPQQLPAAAGGGYGVTLQGPENLRVTVSSDVARSDVSESDPSRPDKLTHVVLNSADVPAQMKFFLDLLGFRLSDSTDRMEFIRCGADHHTIALAHGDGLSLNHAAFEMQDIDGLMYGAGRLIENGYNVEWGLGRHGPGNNVFSYFIDPDGFVVEYTTGMEQIDENSYTSKDAQYWSSFPKRPCRWGVARKPSERLMAAMSGKSLASATN
jgi:catechol 2,3-dioxygenase-like lactoylglutathione lyase family enzyme